jgi:hypothetical protein
VAPPEGSIKDITEALTKIKEEHFEALPEEEKQVFITESFEEDPDARYGAYLMTFWFKEVIYG